MIGSTRHKWSTPHKWPHKTERQCVRCEMVKVTRHETEGGREIHWTEFWRDLERAEYAIDAAVRCAARARARGFP
jgi:hypothetical protein